MLNVLMKEFKLSASILSFLFIGFALMFLLPGYPILCGVFFVCLGIFQSFQKIGENNDILFSVLLPIAKKQVVKGKYLFVCFIQMSAILIMSILTILRMTVLVDLPAYRNNALMNANGFALGVAFIIFGLFNWVFVKGFFETAYKIGRPFVTFIVVAFITLTIAEATHYLPSCSCFNAFGFEHFGLQVTCLIIGIVLYLLLTIISFNIACKDFEKIDL